jgi:pilus assembly protein CpaC
MKFITGSILLTVCFASAAEVAPPPATASSSSPAAAIETRQVHATDSLVNSEAKLTVEVNKSIVVDQSHRIRRVSIANGDVAEAVAVSSRELVVNGRTPGDTSLIVWDPEGKRDYYDVHVFAAPPSVDAVRDELAHEVGPGVAIDVQGNTVFLRGTVPDSVTADRALAIASTIGKVVNLLRVNVPASEPQILLKVRFADVDRSASQALGANLFGLDSTKGIGSATTGAFGGAPAITFSGGAPSASLSDYLNIFFYRPDINLGAVIKALEAKNLLQILAEPNLLTASGRAASFLAGGEFPFPTLQGGGAGVGQITIQFKEFGIRLNFLPIVTPRGTIRLAVTPEVSSLDYANGLNVSGFTVPGLDTRRVQTEVELASGQSLVIAGLLDNQAIETMSKIPGLANIPLLGNLFKSRSISHSNTELMVMVTPELVGPIPVGIPTPQLSLPAPYMKGTPAKPPQNPGPETTGNVQPLEKKETIPVEVLKSTQTAPSAPSGSSAPSPMLPSLPLPSTTASTGTGPTSNR